MKRLRLKINHVKLQHEFCKSKDTLIASRMDFKNFRTKFLPLKINTTVLTYQQGCLEFKNQLK